MVRTTKSIESPTPSRSFDRHKQSCHKIDTCSTIPRVPLKERNIREMRANMGRLDELVAEEGEFVISRRGQPRTRILPMAASAHGGTDSRN